MVSRPASERRARPRQGVGADVSETTDLRNSRRKKIVAGRGGARVDRILDPASRCSFFFPIFFPFFPPLEHFRVTYKLCEYFYCRTRFRKCYDADEVTSAPVTAWQENILRFYGKRRLCVIAGCRTSSFGWRRQVVKTRNSAPTNENAVVAAVSCVPPGSEFRRRGARARSNRDNRRLTL